MLSIFFASFYMCAKLVVKEEEQPLVLVVEAKVLTGVYHDKTKFAKVIFNEVNSSI